MMEPKIPPNSKESEMIVLGCMLTSLGSLHIAADSLEEKDFYLGGHKKIFRVLKKCYKDDKPADVHLVAEELKSSGHLNEIGGIAYLTVVAQYAGIAAHIEEYIGILKKKSLCREIIDMGNEMVGSGLKDPANPADLLEIIYKKTVDLGKGYSPNEYVSIRDIASGEKSRISNDPLMKRLQERQEFYQTHDRPFMTGIPTGFVDLDNQVTLLEPTNLIVVAARPAMGKTALALNIAHHVCFKEGLPVAIISLEMGADQLVDRLISMRTSIPGESLKRGSFNKKDLQRIAEDQCKLIRGKFFIQDQNCSSISQLVSSARRLKDENDIRLLVVDYLQLLGTDGGADSRQYEVAEISRRLKMLAMELQIPVLSIAQLSRKAEERKDKRPLLSDLRDSGQVEQDCDAVLFIYRDDYYNRESSGKRGIAEIYLGKNRHGPTPSISLSFDQECGRFQNQAATTRGISF